MLDFVLCLSILSLHHFSEKVFCLLLFYKSPTNENDHIISILIDLKHAVKIRKMVKKH